MDLEEGDRVFGWCLGLIVIVDGFGEAGEVAIVGSVLNQIFTSLK